MKIELKHIKIREIVEKYKNDKEYGVWAYGGKLNIRPPYQREFVYKEKQRDAVIDTITKNLPISIMYWSKNNDGTFEIIDGQQRTMSICEYAVGSFSTNYRYIFNLTEGEKEQFLDYELLVYICEGTDKEKLEWFRTINIAGEELTEQELRNATYTGPWLSDAKRHFAKTGCPAYDISKDLVKGTAIRQEILETALKWISDRDETELEDYMANHQNDEDANELWIYFQDVIAWVRRTFPNIRKEMKGLPWGILYNKYKDKSLNSKKLEEEISKLMKDDDVTKKSGIYEYLLSENEKYLSIRAFTESQKAQKYEEQKGMCPHCKKEFKREDMEADHIKPWSEGGKTELDNCQMLCRDCNRIKSNK